MQPASNSILQFCSDSTDGKPLDVVWFKRDVRLHDHGPLAAVAPRSDRRVILLFCYEPDQLSESTVHGSHVRFVNEALLDLDRRIHALVVSSGIGYSNESVIDSRGSSSEDCTTQSGFRVLTVCRSEIVAALSAIHEKYAPVARLLAHQETGHLVSFERDKRVRRWCKGNKIPFIELQQMGVTRCLTNRDDFSSKLNQFMNRTVHPTPTRFLCTVVKDLSILPGWTQKPLCDELNEIPIEHRGDRVDRQTGGETKALAVLDSFLGTRGVGFSSGISSPNSSWASCSRLSPYLAWGHISLRHVVQTTRKRQAEVKDLIRNGQRIDERWQRSLAAFQSRLHWRSHFIQKLEMEPELERKDLCPAYQHLRRQPGDWNEDYYIAWSMGKTGFPFVDACTRCLERHGWLNFRMRAMLVSFAAYNLWLDWKRLAPHLARLFLDYEPGIHYPQLQMQAGTTGINAMRVYNVTKQGKDQDPDGIFIRKYVPELSRVPNEYLHEPWKLSISEQIQYGIVIGVDYPEPIVNERESARSAKQRVADVRKTDTAKRQAEQVYQKHGSRNQFRDAALAKSSAKKAKKSDGGQLKISCMLAGTPAKWNCRVCTFLNENTSSLACSMCGTMKKP